MQPFKDPGFLDQIQATLKVHAEFASGTDHQGTVVPTTHACFAAGLATTEKNENALVQVLGILDLSLKGTND